MLRSRYSRRSFLTGLSVGAAALVSPFLRREAAAQSAGASPLRLLVIQSPDGRPLDLWKPTGSTGTNFGLGPTMQPFTPLKSDLVLIDGLDHKAGGGEPHCQNFVQWMTGKAGITTDNYTAAQTASVDQVVAANDAFVGQTPFRSLQIAADMTALSIDVSHRYMSWAGANMPMPSEQRPLQNYARIFSGVTPGGVGGPAAQAALALKIKQKGSVLDLLKKDAARMSAVVPSAQKPYFDAHLTAIRNLETSLSGLATAGQNPQCKLPDMSAFPSATDESGLMMPKFWAANAEIIRLTLACDLSRVITFLGSPSTSNVVHFDWAPGMTTHDHHHASTHDGLTANLTSINLWYANRIAELVMALKSTPDGAGTLLDSTVVLYGTEFGSGGVHSSTNVPFVLFGSAGKKLQTGRYLSYLSAPRSSNDLWLSVLSLLGMPKATIGDPAKCGGPLPGLV